MPAFVGEGRRRGIEIVDFIPGLLFLLLLLLLVVLVFKVFEVLVEAEAVEGEKRLGRPASEA